MSAPTWQQPIIKQIANHDDVLTVMRAKWLASSSAPEKAGWMSKIDSILDERTRLMNIRDTGKRQDG